MRRVQLQRFTGNLIVAAGLCGCGDSFTSPETTAPPLGDNCNGPGAFQENFDDGLLRDVFETSIAPETMVVEERGGQMVFVPEPEHSDGRLIARHAIDLRGAAAVVEVPRVLDAAPGKYTSLSLEVPYGPYLSIDCTEGELRFESEADEGNSSSSIAYNPVDHRWWRFAERDGVVSFDTAPDGQSWTTRHETPTPSFVQAGYLQLGVLDNGQGGEAGEAHFDNFNPQGGSFCGMGQLQEGFDQPTEWNWEVSEVGDCTGTIANGKLGLVVPTGTTGTCNYATRHGYDLRGQSVTVAFDALPPTASGARVELSLNAGDEDEVLLVHRQGSMTVSTEIGATQSSGDAEVGEGPSWWRIREENGRIEVEVSSDGVSFAPVHSAIVDSLPEAFTLNLRLQVFEAQPDGVLIGVDGINAT